MAVTAWSPVMKDENVIMKDENVIMIHDNKLQLQYVLCDGVSRTA
jgi:hypothetical protein